MNLKFKILSIPIILLTLSFSLTKTTESEVKRVLKGMNDFYFSNPISMDYRMERITIDGEIEEEESITSMNIQGDNFINENKEEIHLKNNLYYLIINKEDKEIKLYLSKNLSLESYSPMMKTDWDIYLGQYLDKRVEQNELEYIIILKNEQEEIKLNVSKKNYQLNKYTYVLKDNKQYKEVSAIYFNIRVNQELNSDFFSENKFIKKKGKTFKGTNDYKSYSVDYNN